MTGQADASRNSAFKAKCLLSTRLTFSACKFFPHWLAFKWGGKKVIRNAIVLDISSVFNSSTMENKLAHKTDELEALSRTQWGCLVCRTVFVE